MRLKIYIFCSIIFYLIGCSSGDPKLSYVDLLTYGVPIEIQAPDSVDINTSELGGQTDIVLTGDDGYKIQIFASEAYSNESTAIEDYKSEIRKHPQFKEFVREEPQGFVYAFQLDTNIVNYGFRYIQVKGGKEIIIQQGMLGIYTREEAEKLFNYALQSK